MDGGRIALQVSAVFSRDFVSTASHRSDDAKSILEGLSAGHRSSSAKATADRARQISVPFFLEGFLEL
jgi:hypothetical protein